MIVIIDYGMGNVGSIQNMFRKIGSESKISFAHDDIKTADRLVLPGVGAFDSGMSQLRNSGLIEIINERVVAGGVPVLGICLGMQLMTAGSEEGMSSGLGWVDGKTIRFEDESVTKLKVPHMGWNTVKINKDSKLFYDSNTEQRFYFVHSYHVVCNRSEDILTTTWYGREFVSSFQAANVMGVQFHPEKSHKYGMSLLRNFAQM